MKISKFMAAAVVVALCACGNTKENASNDSLDLNVEGIETGIEEVDGDDVLTDASDNDFDEVLDSYEEFVDEYVSVVKDAKGGDVTALSKATELQQKAEELGKKMENAKGDLTAEQLARYQKLLKKMQDAMTEM